MARKRVKLKTRKRRRKRSHRRRTIIHNVARTKIYIVRKKSSRSQVVVKRFRDRIQFIRERRALSSLSDHTYIVKYHRSYIRKGYGHVVMERVKGRTLRSVARRHGPFNVDKTIDMAITILQGVKVIHDHGYVHGDFHSQNVIVTDFEKPAIKIIDFQHAVKKNSRGVARAYRKLARPPVKLPPETRRRHVRDSYDIYGVGYMCSMMLRGRPPGRRSTIVPRRRAQEPIWAVVRKATRRDPKQRYQSAQEMIQALQALKGGQQGPPTEDNQALETVQSP